MVDKRELVDDVVDQSSSIAVDDDDDDDDDVDDGDATNERMVLDVTTSQPTRQDAFCQTTKSIIDDE